MLVNTIATRFVRYSSVAPRAHTMLPASSVIPIVARGGTSATATATPGSALEVSDRTVVATGPGTEFVVIRQFEVSDRTVA